MSVAPTYVATDYQHAYFNPVDPSLPVIDRGGVYITDQDILDAVIASASAAEIELLISATPFNWGVIPDITPPPINPPFPRFDLPQSLTLEEQEQLWANIGLTEDALTALGVGALDLVVPPSGDTTGATDLANINAAIVAVNAAGNGSVALKRGHAFYVNGTVIIMSNVNYTTKGAVLTLVTGCNCNIYRNHASTPLSTANDGAATLGSNVYTTTLGATVAIGDTITIMGAGPNNPGQGAVPVNGVVGAKTSTTVTLYKPFTAINPADPTTGKPANAGNTVAGALVSRFVYDTNVKMDLGLTIRASGNATNPDPSVLANNLALRSIHLRYIDGLDFAGDQLTSTDSLAYMNVAGLANAHFKVTKMASAKGGLIMMGPLYNIEIIEVSGASGDDSFAVLCNDWVQFCDTCGDATNISIGNINTVAVNGSCCKLVAGVGNTLDEVKVYGQVHGIADDFIAVVGSVTIRTTGGGKHGHIDLGKVSGTISQASGSNSLVALIDIDARLVEVDVSYAGTAPLNAVVQYISNSSGVTHQVDKLIVHGHADATVCSAPYHFIGLGSTSVVKQLITDATFLVKSATSNTSLVQMQGTTAVAEVIDLIGANVRGTSTSFGYGISSDHTSTQVKEIRLIGGRYEGLKNVIQLEQASYSLTFDGGVSVYNCARVASGGTAGSGTKTITFGTCTFDTISSEAFYAGAGSDLWLFRGMAPRIVGSFTLWAMLPAAAATVQVQGGGIPIDFSTSNFVPALNDRAYDVASRTGAPGECYWNGVKWVNTQQPLPGQRIGYVDYWPATAQTTATTTATTPTDLSALAIVVSSWPNYAVGMFDVSIIWPASGVVHAVLDMKSFKEASTGDQHSVACVYSGASHNIAATIVDSGQNATSVRAFKPTEWFLTAAMVKNTAGATPVPGDTVVLRPQVNCAATSQTLSVIVGGTNGAVKFIVDAA